MEVTESLTRKVAGLARLKLTDAEVKSFTEQLGKILGYVAKLQEVDTQGVEPMTTALEIETPMREDRVREFPMEGGKPKVLIHAPEVLHDGFKVPPIL